jgi:hypothetical protein
MAMDLPEGTKVRVISGLYNRYSSRKDMPDVRLFRDQTFHIGEDDADDLLRNDIHLLLEVVQEVPDTPAQEDEPTEDEVWGDNIDVEQLSEQLSGMNITTAKKWLSQDEWTEEGMARALDAEKAGENRKGLIEFIEGRQLDLAEGEVDEGEVADPADEADVDDDADDEQN